jgi:hypothetical protein
MGSAFGGITRSGVDGSYSYSVRRDRGEMPVNYESFYDALRFVNWLNNGQGNGDTRPAPIRCSAEPRSRATGRRWLAMREPRSSSRPKMNGTRRPTTARAASTTTTRRARTRRRSARRPRRPPTGPTVRTPSAIHDRRQLSGLGEPVRDVRSGWNAEEWTETNIGGFRIVRGGYFLVPVPAGARVCEQ